MRMPMGDAGLLTLIQWLSPAFPVGGFAWSHGLEAAISSGDVRTSGDVENWIGAVLCRGSGLSDAVLLCAALDPEEDLHALAALAEGLAASRERWEETSAQGAAFAQTVNAVSGSEVPSVALPVAVGAAARSLNLPAARVAELYLNAFVTNLVSAAVRFVPLGQTEGQRILASLRSKILEVAAEATSTPVECLGMGVPGADLAAMAHETLEVRIFRS